MLLKEFIDSVSDNANLSLRSENRQLRKSLMAYFADSYGTKDILDLTAKGWSNKYFTFLLNEYRPNKSKETIDKWQIVGLSKERGRILANKHISILRRIIRNATENGVFPNIDILSELDDFRRKKNVALPNYVEQLRSFATNEKILRLKFARQYLLALCLCGTELRELPTAIDKYMKKRITCFGSYESEISSSQWIEKQLGLFHDSEYNSKIASESISSVMNSLGLKLYASKSIFIDWLNIGHSLGIFKSEDMRQLIAIRRGEDTTDALKDKIIDVSNKIIKICESTNLLKTEYFWVAVIAFGRSAEDLESHILNQINSNDSKSGIITSSTRDFKTLCFCKRLPQQKNSVNRRNYDPNVIDLKNILFIKLTEEIGKSLEMQFSDISILSTRVGTQRRWCRINPHDLEIMAKILGYFSGERPIILSSDPEKKSKLSQNEEVTLKIDLWGEARKGRKGIVVKHDKKISDSYTDYYIVSFMLDNGFEFQMSINRDDLESIK